MEKQFEEKTEYEKAKERVENNHKSIYGEDKKDEEEIEDKKDKEEIEDKKDKEEIEDKKDKETKNNLEILDDLEKELEEYEKAKGWMKNDPKVKDVYNSKIKAMQANRDRQKQILRGYIISAIESLQKLNDIILPYIKVTDVNANVKQVLIQKRIDEIEQNIQELSVEREMTSASIPSKILEHNENKKQERKKLDDQIAKKIDSSTYEKDVHEPERISLIKEIADLRKQREEIQDYETEEMKKVSEIDKKIQGLREEKAKLEKDKAMYEVERRQGLLNEYEDNQKKKEEYEKLAEDKGIVLYVPTKGPTTEGPTTEEPTTEEPTTEGPTTEEPTTEGPTTEEPTTEEPTTEGPTTEEPTTEGPTTEEPTTEEPTTEGPTTEEPTTEEPIVTGRTSSRDLRFNNGEEIDSENKYIKDNRMLPVEYYQAKNSGNIELANLILQHRYERDEDGSVKIDDNGNPVYKEDGLQEALKEYREIEAKREEKPKKQTKVEDMINKISKEDMEALEEFESMTDIVQYLQLNGIERNYTNAVKIADKLLGREEQQTENEEEKGETEEVEKTGLLTRIANKFRKDKKDKSTKAISKVKKPGIFKRIANWLKRNDDVEESKTVDEEEFVDIITGEEYSAKKASEIEERSSESAGKQESNKETDKEIDGETDKEIDEILNDVEDLKNKYGVIGNEATEENDEILNESRKSEEAIRFAQKVGEKSGVTDQIKENIVEIGQKFDEKQKHQAGIDHVNENTQDDDLESPPF